MFPLILPEYIFDKLLMIFAIGPLPLLFLVPRITRTERQRPLASFILFLPALLLISLWLVTNGETKPPLRDVGPGLVIGSAMWAGGCCIASFICGLGCVRTFRWALLWMIPEGLFALLVLCGVVLTFFPHLFFPRH